MNKNAINHKKVLFVAKVAKGHILTFHIPYLKMLKEMGCEVHVATGDEAEIPYCDVKYTVPIKGSPIRLDNFKAYRELKEIIGKEQYDLVHTHTSMGGAIGRLAAKQSRKHGTAVMHTAHGFAFYKGAPLLSWLLYYSMEKICSYFTDCLITMNNEDYSASINRLRAKQNSFISGIGVDVEQIKNINVEKYHKRMNLGVTPEKILILSVGELIKRKNHKIGIKAIKKLIEKGHTNIHYIICGRGELHEYLKNLIDELGLQEYVTLAGFRNDIHEIMKCADIFLFPSIYEGLPVSVIEAMAAELPVVASDIRGSSDLIRNSEGGLLVPPYNIGAFENCIEELIRNKDLRDEMGRRNEINVGKYDLNIVVRRMAEIYGKYLNI